MSDWFHDLGAVEWFREQFNPETVTAWSVFRLMLMSWVVAAAAFIGLDRLSSVLLGRSRPLAQEPPVRARAWRWGRKNPPGNYSLMPPGTTVESAVPYVAAPVPLVRPLALGSGAMPTVELPDPALPLSDGDFWRLFADDAAPIFGYENGTRLGRGDAPERYNPITGKVEMLDRDERAGTLGWAWLPDDPHVVGPE